MPPAARILEANSDVLPATRPSDPFAVDSDVVVILAALLCALICVVGLALVARCAWLRRGASAAPPCKGLKRKALGDLPKVAYAASEDAKLAECPICLAEFVGGDEIRILPQCGHGFHVGCVDTWLMSRSSCPSCRRALIVADPAAQPSPRYGASSEDSCATTSAVSATEEAAKAREDGGAGTFLP